jgi:RNA polymerase sigma factor (sigma-70 family)
MSHAHLPRRDEGYAMRSESLVEAEPEADLDALVADLFESYYQPICTYIFCLVDEWELAHDLTQETFLQLFHTRQRLRQVENARAWLYRIATHVTLNKLKRQRRFAWLPWHTLEDTPQFRWQAPDEEVNRRTAVENALAALPAHYRAPLLLYSESGLSVREVAEALGIRENTVKVQLHRARTLFRQAYAQEDEVDRADPGDSATQDDEAQKEE